MFKLNRPKTAGGGCKKAAAAKKLRGLKLEDVQEDNPRLKELLEKRRKRITVKDDAHEYDFWVCLVFQNYDQKVRFLRHFKDVPNVYGLYVDGQTLAQALGVPIRPNTVTPRKTIVRKRLEQLVLAKQKRLAQERMRQAGTF